MVDSQYPEWSAQEAMNALTLNYDPTLRENNRQRGEDAGPRGLLAPRQYNAMNI